ncbi:Kininogen-1 [Cladobotryum mycophilum]|uniref:Kininogen-1 n=1 Tax=Cladobotryum mycophilum TaxID=491253 RepID=A0ABR0SS09_9HYPO
MRFMLALLALPTTITAAALSEKNYPCFGCPVDADPQSPDIKELEPRLTAYFNKHSQSEYYGCLKEITKAKKQVVVGAKYELTVLFQESASKKDDNTHDCSASEGSKTECELAVWVQIWLNQYHITGHCVNPALE